MSEATPTLGCEDLRVTFTVSTPQGQHTVEAVRGVSVAVERGRVLGVVGESGSGKTTLARALVGLQPATAGTVRCGDLDLADRSREARRRLGRTVSMVFQDPRSSLNPRLSVRSVVADPLAVHGVGAREARAEAVSRLLADVGLPERLADRRVRTLSGGQLQRVAIARALALGPDFIVADEPTSALDVSIQAQILNLIAELRREHGFGMLVISHDMRVMRFLCDDLAVMLRGEVIERGSAEQIYGDPQHPYTQRLVGATPLLSSYHLTA